MRLYLYASAHLLVIINTIMRLSSLNLVLHYRAKFGIIKLNRDIPTCISTYLICFDFHPKGRIMCNSLMSIGDCKSIGKIFKKISAKFSNWLCCSESCALSKLNWKHQKSIADIKSQISNPILRINSYFCLFLLLNSRKRKRNLNYEFAESCNP